MPATSSTRVKVCGITNLHDARLAAELGAWALGLIFHPGSPRACPHEEAELIGAALRRRVELCGVFVNAPLDTVARLAERARLSLVQLHGDEGPAYCEAVARRTGARVIKAKAVRSQADLRALRSFHVDYWLLDSGAHGLRGGTGVPFDWSLATGTRASVPIILSGGLSADNVAEAIAVVRPFAVDAASGTELGPGRKDPARLGALLAAVRRADEQRAGAPPASTAGAR